jgi:hypothetical protein
MPKFNSNSIKKFKSKMVMLKYTTHKVSHELSGVITAATKKHVLFLVNNDRTADEITLIYDNILDITLPEKIIIAPSS